MRTRDENSWDSYSKEWKTGGDESLGIEWGNDELTLEVFEKYLRPHLEPGSRVLEIGPGGGKYSVLAAPLCKSLVCADVSAQMLRRVRERLADCQGLETLKLNGADLSGIGDETLDLAFSIDVFVHLELEDIYSYVREMHRALRPGGTIVLHFANFVSRPGWDLFHRRADYNRAQIRQIGRINYITVEMIRWIFEAVRFEAIEFDTTTSPRDFLVRAIKPLLPDEPEAAVRAQRIQARTEHDAVIALDFLTRLPYSVQSAEPDYVTATEYELGGDARQALFMHPPSRVGYAITVPEKAILCTAIGIHPEAQDRCSAGGVTFSVHVHKGIRVDSVFERTLDPASRPEDRAWQDVRLDLGAYAGEVVFLVFETGIDDVDNEYNWAAWAEPALVVADAEALGARRPEVPEPEEELLSLQDHLVNLISERDALRSHATVLEAELDALRGHSEVIERECTALRGHTAEIEPERDALRGHAATLEVERNALRGHADNLEAELSAFRQHADALLADRDALRQQVDALTAHRDDLQARLEGHG